MKIHSSEICSLLDLKGKFPFDGRKEYLSIDSRHISHPESTLFICLDGHKTSGADFVLECIDKGVRHILISRLYDFQFESISHLANFYFVENVLDSFQKLVSHQRQNYKTNTIGITGSNGKTIVKEWLSQILREEEQIVKSPKSYNSQLGVPLSVWNLNKNHTLAIFEAGISEPNSMVKLEEIIRPNIGILTHLGSAHQSSFASLEDKLKEKLNLFVHSDVLILQKKLVDTYNNAFCDLNRVNSILQYFTWGNDEKANVFIDKDPSLNKLVVKYNNQCWEIDLRRNDDAFVENISTCISALLLLKNDLGIYIDKIEQIDNLEMRLEVKSGILNMTLINDTYTADLDSLTIALQYLTSHSEGSNRSIVLSEISESSIEQILTLLESNELNRIILIGIKFQTHKDRISKSFHHYSIYDTTSDFIKHFDFNVFHNQFVLVKGARKFHFEDIIHHLTLKTHNAYLKVNQNALINNLNIYRQKLSPSTKIMAMIKANGYGLGSIDLARLLEKEGVHYLAVANIDEGVELRLAGITKPIMICNPDLDNLDKLIEYNLDPEIYSIRLLEKLSHSLSISFHQSSEFYIHLKIESGMHRLGIEEEKIDTAIQIINSSTTLKVRSIMSHLSASDDESLDEFTHSQLKSFENNCTKIDSQIGYPTIKHILNSCGISRHHSAQMNMVRLGIGLFGFDVSVKDQLQTACSLYARISQIKSLSKDESTGYSRSGRVHRDSKIAILNIGYADGYSRQLGNGKAQVYINGQFAPTIGNICMDMMMVDITDLYSVTEGDEVELFGENISVLELAKTCHTISYEILTSVSDRIQRVYFQD